MTWVTDIASSLGVPAGGMTLSIAVYNGCIAAEKEARQESLLKIGRALLNKDFYAKLEPSNLVKKMLDYMFSRNHFSRKCVLRSFCATYAVIFALTLQYAVAMHLPPDKIIKDFPLAIFFVFLPIVDYFSLGKTRIIMKYSELRKTPPLLSALIDIFVTLFGLCALYSALLIIAEPRGASILNESINILKEVRHDLGPLFRHNDDKFPFSGLLFISTLIGPLWICLAYTSIYLIRMMKPVQDFISWFFVVEEHPLRAIGVVAATFIMAVSLLWAIF